MERVRRRKTGVCLKCDDTCATCRRRATYCTSCPSGYTRRCGKCLTVKKIRYKCVFAQSISFFFLRIVRFKLKCCSFIGGFFLRKIRFLTFFRCRRGSTELEGTLDVPEGQSGTDAFNALNGGLAAGNEVEGLTITSSTVTAENVESESADVNLGLILGLAIPLTIIGTPLFI